MIAEERVQRVEQSVQRLIQDIQRLPAEVLYAEPGQGEWPVMSTLAHLCELLPYWAHQAEAIVRAPGAPFGRTHEDPDRIAAVEHHGHDSLETMLSRLRASLDECVTSLRGLPEAGWSAAGQHPTRGSMSVERMIDTFLVQHAEEHARQARATVQALGTPRA